MRMGTRSLLFGAHQFILHPLFVLAGWVRLYGWPKRWQIYLAILVHDWGLWGSPNMDGPEGARHPELGGRLMTALCGPEWGSFTRRHSRRYARLEGLETSQLCHADKLGGTAMVWLPLYVALVRLTGEYREYMTVEQPLSGVYQGTSIVEWARHVQRVIRENTPGLVSAGVEPF